MPFSLRLVAAAVRRAARTSTLLVGVLAIVCLFAFNVDAAGATATQQDGVALPTWYYNGYASTASDQQIGQIQQAGANWVAVGPELVMPGPTSSQISTSAHNTSTDAGLTRAISVAHAAGMHVMLRPFVDSATSGRTVINPTNRAKWFANYTVWMVHYATLAQKDGVEEMSIGSDYQQLSSDRADWANVIAAVRAHYTGLLTYDADIYEYPHVAFWDLLDYIGIDAYYPLTVADQHSVPQLVAAWQPIIQQLAQFSATQGKQILFTEAGYLSVANAITNPSQASMTGAVDDDGQADDYQALLQATQNQPWFAGVFWWMWDTIGATSEDTSYSPHNKPAESVLQAFWGQNYGTSGTTTNSNNSPTPGPAAAVTTTTPAPAVTTSTGSTTATAPSQPAAVTTSPRLSAVVTSTGSKTTTPATTAAKASKRHKKAKLAATHHRRRRADKKRRHTTSPRTGSSVTKRSGH